MRSFPFLSTGGLHQALPIGNDVCVISLLQFLKEALYLWNVHHIPPGAGPPHRSRLAHHALDLLQGGPFLTQRPSRQDCVPLSR